MIDPSSPSKCTHPRQPIGTNCWLPWPQYTAPTCVHNGECCTLALPMYMHCSSELTIQRQWINSTSGKQRSVDAAQWMQLSGCNTMDAAQWMQLNRCSTVGAAQWVAAQWMQCSGWQLSGCSLVSDSSVDAGNSGETATPVRKHIQHQGSCRLRL